MFLNHNNKKRLKKKPELNVFGLQWRLLFRKVLKKRNGRKKKQLKELLHKLQMAPMHNPGCHFDQLSS